MNRPWMPLYVADYLADTAHLNAAQSGAYLHLIMHYWQTGSLPDDDHALARIGRMTAGEWRKARPIIAPFFFDGWRHKRVDAELARAADISSKRRASAEQRHSKSNANAEQLDTHARASSQSQLQEEEPSLRSAPPPQLLLEATFLGSSTSSLPRASANAVPWPGDYRERFWELFPNKIGKASAIKKLEKIAKSDRVTFLDLMAALDRYVRKTDDRPWCNPETWINQERWTDEPAKANGHGKPDLAAMCFDLADELRARETAGPADRPIDLPGSHRNGR